MPEPWRLHAAYRGREFLQAAAHWRGYVIGHREDTWPWEELRAGVEASVSVLQPMEGLPVAEGLLRVVVRLVAGLSEMARPQMALEHTDRQHQPRAGPAHTGWPAAVG
jgi:hypothetical protein